MLKPRIRIPRGGSSLFRQWSGTPMAAVPARFTHSMPVLNTNLERIQAEGITPVMSPASFNMAWTQYQDMTLQRLDDWIAGTEFEDMQVQEIVEQTAREPKYASIFNYASMAYNNHFFFEGILPDRDFASSTTSQSQDRSSSTSLTTPPPGMSQTLAEALESSFSSLETLRREFLITASSMFGPGFVWLVKFQKNTTAYGGGYGAATNPSSSLSSGGSNSNSFRLLTTYLAGSPLPKAHWRRQTQDMNVAGDPSIHQYFARQNEANGMFPPDPSAGEESSSIGGAVTPSQQSQQQPQQTITTKKRAEKTMKPPGGVPLVPVLCLNTWEHAWLGDYGVAGKSRYVENWWKAINWKTVEDRAKLDRSPLPDRRS